MSVYSVQVYKRRKLQLCLRTFLYLDIKKNVFVFDRINGLNLKRRKKDIIIIISSFQLNVNCNVIKLFSLMYS